MKLLFAIVLMVLTLSNANTQPKGVDFDNAVILSEANYEDNFERLCKLPDASEGYLFYFRPTTIGVKHSHDKVLELLIANNLKFDEPDLNRDYLGDDIKGITDYENISFYAGLDQAEIDRVWLLEDGPWGINWAITGGLVAVVIKPFSEGEVERKKQVEIERQRQTEQLNNMGRNASGNPDAGRYDTGGGLGESISFGGLGSGREARNLPKPDVSGCEVTNRIEVTVDIQVNRDGKVVGASVRNASFSDNCIWTMVVEAAKNSQFSLDKNASYSQSGWIKYIIVP